MWSVEIMEGRYFPRECIGSEFDDIGKTVGTMLRCRRPIWNCAKVVIVVSGLCVTKDLAETRKKGLFGAALIKKRIYWPANIKGDAIDAHFTFK